MPWARLDDAILDNPKIARVGPLGFALHIAGITYCARNLTDGRVPFGRVALLLRMDGCVVDGSAHDGHIPWPRQFDGDARLGQVADSYEVAEILVRVGLWEKLDDGDWLVHDYLEYNPSRDQVMAEREGARIRQQRSRQKSHRDLRVTSPRVTGAPVPVPESEVVTNVTPSSARTADRGSDVKNGRTRATSPKRYSEQGDALARELWEVLDPKPIAGFVGFRERISETLTAGHAPDAIRHAAPSVMTWTRASIELAINRGRNGNGRHDDEYGQL